MKTNYLLLFCVFLFLHTNSRAQSPITVNGVWNIVVETPMGSGTPVFVLKQLNDSTITGTYTGQLGDSELTGKRKGNKIYISFTISGNLIEYDGVVEGDTMKGKVKLGSMAEGVFTGTRKKE